MTMTPILRTPTNLMAKTIEVPVKKQQNTNAHHIKFAQIYLLNGGNATEAALAVMSPNTKRGVAASTAQRWLARADIQQYLMENLEKIGSHDFIKREILKDIMYGQPNQRTAGLALLAKIEGMVLDKLLNIDAQKEELNGLTYGSFNETKEKQNLA